MDWPHARRVIEAVVGALLLILAFYGIASADVSAAGSQTFWTVLVLAYGAAAIAGGWLYGGLLEGDPSRARAVLRVVLHWVAVLVAVELVYIFIAAGRLTNANVGLTNGLVLALGTFLAGVHGTWRAMVIGLALALATVCVAYVEQYLWVLLGLAVLAIVVLVLVAEVLHRRRQRV